MTTTGAQLTTAAAVVVLVVVVVSVDADTPVFWSHDSVELLRSSEKRHWERCGDVDWIVAVVAAA